MRDNFTKPTIEMLAKRVGYRCSNPNCRQLTSGPRTVSDKAINVGEAAHITAAALDGPRYDSYLTPEERKSIDNGIWLCSKCAKLIDSDTDRYTVQLLRDWKRLSEEAALLEIEGKYFKATQGGKREVDFIRFYSQCLDRPAFKDVFLREQEIYSAFDRAIEDTITAINTGCLRSRDGAVLAKSKGKSFLENRVWREKMDTIVDLLRAIRVRYRTMYGIRSHREFIQLGEWMDATRDQVIQMFNEICEEADIPPLRSPKHYW